MNYGTRLHALFEGWMDDAPDITVTSITQEPARVRAGTALVVLGQRSMPDAVALRQAADHGCVAVLHDATLALPAADIPAVPVPGLAGRAGELASRFWAAPSDLMTIAAVAGTAHRAAIAHYLAQVWQRCCGGAGLFGSLGRGPMETLQPLDPASADVFALNETLATCLDDGIERAVVEVSPAALLQGRCQTLQIDLAIITGAQRRGGPGQPERRLFTEFAPAFAAINLDDPVCARWAREFAVATEMFSYGLESNAELTGRIVTMDDQGMALRLSGPWGDAVVLSDLHGEAEARNLLAVAATLVLLGMDWHEACRELEYLRPAPRSADRQKRPWPMERAA